MEDIFCCFCFRSSMEQNIGRNEGKVLSNKSPKLISVWGSFLNTLEKVLAENPQGVIFEILPSFFSGYFLWKQLLKEQIFQEFLKIFWISYCRNPWKNLKESAEGIIGRISMLFESFRPRRETKWIWNRHCY